MSEQKVPPSVSTNDLDAATWLYAQGVPLLGHTDNGRRTTFTFQGAAALLQRFYSTDGAQARQLFLARRTLMGIIHEDGR